MGVVHSKLEPPSLTPVRMPNIKLTYFDLRARAEPCRLLLAYGGLQYKDERIPPPWDPASTWATVKPTTPFGQLPLLKWGDEVICQSMACARFVAREVGLAGNTSMESAQVDEIIDVIQDLINAGVKLFFAKDEAGQKNHAEVTVPTALGQLETKLASRGGSSLLGTTSPGLTSIPSCTSVISLTKVSSKVSPSLPTWLRELEIFRTSRTGWRPDLSPLCKLQYHPHTFITFYNKTFCKKK